LQNELTVDYDYSARTAEADPAVDGEHHGDVNYQNLLQILVPRGSVLNETENLSFAPIVEEEEDYSRFVADTAITYDIDQTIIEFDVTLRTDQWVTVIYAP